jgi:hypothetical protein
MIFRYGSIRIKRIGEPCGAVVDKGGIVDKGDEI